MQKRRNRAETERKLIITAAKRMTFLEVGVPIAKVKRGTSLSLSIVRACSTPFSGRILGAPHEHTQTRACAFRLSSCLHTAVRCVHARVPCVALGVFCRR